MLYGYGAILLYSTDLILANIYGTLEFSGESWLPFDRKIISCVEEINMARFVMQYRLDRCPYLWCDHRESQAIFNA